jgi:hypothetical protein
MRGRIVTLAAAVLVVLAGCNVAPGSGRAASETRQVSGFTNIDLRGVGDVIVRQGDSEALTIEADDNVLPNLTSDVVDGTLRLDRKPGFGLRSQTPIRYQVTVTDLDGLTLSGSGTVVAENLTVDSLSTDISGSGVVTLSGTATDQRVVVSGSGRHEASRMATDRVTANVSGSGEIVVDVRQDLRVDISGSGTVTYSGDPSVSESISGSGRLVKK